MNNLITGVSSGLGKALSDEYLNLGYQVYGLSKTSAKDTNHVSCDLNNLESIINKLEILLDGVYEIENVILNAGILGKIKLIKEWNTREINNIMNTNMWSNKIIIDWLINNKKLKNVVAISSGASNKTYKGWLGYSISKAALNMLIQNYSTEFSNINFCSLAPGLVETDMQKHIRNNIDENKFSWVKKFKSAKESGDVKSPNDVAKNIIKVIEKLSEYDNGQFIDVRDLR